MIPSSRKASVINSVAKSDRTVRPLAAATTTLVFHREYKELPAMSDPVLGLTGTLTTPIRGEHMLGEVLVAIRGGPSCTSHEPTR